MKLKQKITMKKEKAITLIALVVTIVILLILAGVSISMLTGENGVISQAQTAKLETRGGDVEERVSIWKNENRLNKYSNIEVKSESDFIRDLKEQKLVYDNEINEENKIIKIGSREIYYGIEETDITALKFLVNSGDDGIVVLPIDKNDCNELGYQVDWGDGSTGIDETIIASNKKKIASLDKIYVADLFYGIPHTYVEKNKQFIVTITGNMNCITTNAYNTTASKIIEVLQWGETGLEYIYLGNCQNLRKIASPSANSFVNITSFEKAFILCENLTEIPSDLFSNCPNVTNFQWTFSGCTSLTRIPENLFTNCPNVTNFQWTFSGCTSLTRIPENLFTNCLNVTNFLETFVGCRSLTGNAPELWKRGTNSEENNYMGDPIGAGCFYECEGLSNYDMIPDYWKRSGK